MAMRDSEKTWEKSMTIDGITKSVKVREIENGYIVRLCRCGRVESKDGGSEWIDEVKEVFSKENPLKEQLDLPQMAKDTASSLGINLMFE